ncbi:Uncharacterised protein [Bordetella pertussis]|nr:Uncharacterised protein [Bordetella pertussis]
MLAFLQRLQVALLDLPPLMGRMDTLLEQGTRFLAGSASLRKAYLRKAANSKEVLLALQAVLPPPVLAAGGLDRQEQAPPSESFQSRSVSLADLILASVSRFSGIVGFHCGEKYPHG